MGWDIHAFIEHSEWGETPFMKDFVLCFGEVYLYRNYDIFGALGPIGNNPHPLFPPRGIPYPMSIMALGSIQMSILDEDHEKKIIRSEDGTDLLLQQYRVQGSQETILCDCYG